MTTTKRVMSLFVAGPLAAQDEPLEIEVGDPDNSPLTDALAAALLGPAYALDRVRLFLGEDEIDYWVADVPAKTCPATLSVGGATYPCDWPTDVEGKHDGWAHANSEAEAIWRGNEGPSDR